MEVQQFVPVQELFHLPFSSHKYLTQIQGRMTQSMYRFQPSHYWRVHLSHPYHLKQWLQGVGNVTTWMLPVYLLFGESCLWGDYQTHRSSFQLWLCWSCVLLNTFSTCRLAFQNNFWWSTVVFHIFQKNHSVQSTSMAVHALPQLQLCMWDSHHLPLWNKPFL